MRGIKTDKNSGFIFPNVDKISSSSVNGSIKKNISLLPDGDQIGKDMNKFAILISSMSKETMIKYIGSRVDTGLMKGSVRGRTDKRAKKVISRAGWIDRWHKYFGFQEDGTRKISPMHSVMRTYLEMAPIVQRELNDYFRNYTRKGGFK